jgi:hypothetical protein
LLAIRQVVGRIAILNDYTRYQEEPGNAYPEALPRLSQPRQSLWTSVTRLCLEVKLYPFNLRESIPQFLLPLQSGDAEPVVNLSEVLGEVYQEAALDLAIDYSVQPVPPLSEGDFQWVRSMMES